MATQQQRSDSTRALLLEAFRASLLKQGLDKTTMQAVLTDTGLSKGALYHHFKSKTDIVEANNSEESRQTIERAFKKANRSQGPLYRLKSACLAWTEEVRKPRVSKILFEIGPTALGPERARSIEDAHSAPLMDSLLKEAVSAGDIEDTDLQLFRSFLNALIEQAALHQLRTGRNAQDMLGRAIQGLFDTLKPTDAISATRL